ncbi:gamma-glutamyltransferase [Pseudonocardia sp. C8]|uniref:gamma-glutamyltransferase n=1 Tax=Pseudonocardia sp. C8 TaxID=2762759 RepID=UPI00351C2A22
MQGRRAAIVTSHPLATRAGREAMRDGGTVVDAALAAAAMQLVVEPHMTSLTGGLSMLHRDGASGVAEYLGGNVAAPAAPLPGFTGADLTTGRGVPVPGWWPAFRAASARHGTLPLARLLDPAIRVARDGFPVGPYLYGEVYANRTVLGSHPQGREVFLPAGSLVEPGATLRQPRVARTLERLAGEDLDYYLGDFARAFAEEARRGGGVITSEDLAANDPRWSSPLRGTYRGNEVLSSVPPDDGGSQVIEALNLLELFDLRAMGPPSASVDTLELLTDVHEEVYYAPPRRDAGDRGGRLSKEFARRRIDRLGRAPSAAAVPSPGTIHITVLDGEGNVASITHSHMASPWVNGLFAEGFALSGGGSFFQRGMPWPREKALVYLAPTVVLREGRPVMACGSPSVSLVACILQGIVNVVDFEMPVEQAVEAPRFGVRPHEPAHGWLPGVTVEHGFADGVEPEFHRRATVRGRWTRSIGPWHSLTGNLEAVTFSTVTGELHSCADPRRNGAAEAW